MCDGGIVFSRLRKLRQAKSVTYLKPILLWGFKFIHGVKGKAHASLFQAHATFYYFLEEILNAVKYSAVYQCLEFLVLPFIFVPKYTLVIILIWFAAIWIKWKKPALVLVSSWLHSFLLADFLSSCVSDGMTWQILFKLQSLTQLQNILLVHNDIVKHIRGGQTCYLPKVISLSTLGNEINWWVTEWLTVGEAPQFCGFELKIPSGKLYSL